MRPADEKSSILVDDVRRTLDKAEHEVSTASSKFQQEIDSEDALVGND